ncbi:MAG: nucleoside triphosphate pyrophosphohydrolase [Pseudomonadota bacterium]
MNEPPIHQLLAIMARLRDPQGGCPWDRQQSFASIAPYTIEEAYEVADAIEQGDMAALRDELGDLLFQVVFHARMAEEAGAFAFDDVVEAIVEKMTRRHPHVFGEAEVADAVAQTREWEAHKAKERRDKGGHHSRLDGVTLALPALSRAAKLQKRAARGGLDWPSVDGVLGRVEEELNEVRAELDEADPVRLEDEIGDLLFAAVNLARHAGVDAETALRSASGKFERGFRALETQLEREGRAMEQCTSDELDRLWLEAKREQR